MSIMCVFLYKKYNNQTQVTRLNREFQYKDLRKATNNFRDKLGGGMSGSVYKGKLDDGTLVAVKKIEGEANGQRVFQAEISIIEIVDHAHLVCLRGYCSHITQTEGTFFIVYDLFTNGSLENWIFSRKAGQNGEFLSWKQSYRVAIEVAKALSHLHHDCSQRILHLDIKPENVLLDEDFRAILSDFGLSKLMSKDKSKTHITERGTYGYKAPSGTWLMGYQRNVISIIMEQQTFHAFMWEKLTQMKHVDLIDKRLMANGEVDENEASCLVYVALCCLEEDPKRRPGDMRHVVDMLEGRKLDGTDISTKVFPYKEYDNQRNVARFCREFRHKELKMATNDFRKKLGSGGSRSVFKGILNDGTQVAVKRVQSTIHGEQEFQEVSEIASLEHAHFVHLRGYCRHVMEAGNVSLFVYDFFSNGSLDYWIFPWKGEFSYWGLRYKVAENANSSYWGFRYKVAENDDNLLPDTRDIPVGHTWSIPPSDIPIP
ncbi:hypothetical protein GIB67_002769 [Kingdonia uniflora]|uniref:Protein kinase domain-containing protein n=1 Tax=Kingdonia uniflora TaxID=39325 RepID=A0A7J7LSN2_9MAGN|nr:hypothetical protein GIB67_002769 [Kingdonia uniflora]